MRKTIDIIFYGVIAYMPSSSVYSGMSESMEPAWTLHGKPIEPYNKEGFSDRENWDLMSRGKIPNHPGSFEDPYQFTDIFLYWMQKEADTFERAAIPVEKIQCPIIIFSGEDDRIWPSTLYCNAIMERLDQTGSTIERSHFNYRDAGHLVNSCFNSLSDRLSTPSTCLA